MPVYVITVPQRHRQTDGRSQTDDILWHNRALRIVPRGKKRWKESRNYILIAMVIQSRKVPNRPGWNTACHRRSACCWIHSKHRH